MFVPVYTTVDRKWCLLAGGNLFGRGTAWVRSNNPHLLQTCVHFRQAFRRLHEAYHFPRTEHRATPRLCRRCSTVEALSTYAVAEFHLRIVRKNDWMSRRTMEEWANRALRTGNAWLRWCGGKI